MCVVCTLGFVGQQKLGQRSINEAPQARAVDAGVLM